MEEQVVRGVRWTLLGFAITSSLGTVATLTLARLLVPQDFGIVAFATVVISLVRYFVTLGLGPAIVIRPDLNDVTLATGYSLLLFLHAFAAAAICALSPLASSVLDQDAATPVLLTLAAPLFFGGIPAFRGALLQRELQFRRQFSVQVAQVVVRSSLSIALALAGVGLWSLVIGHIVAESVAAVLYLASPPARIRPRWNAGAARWLWRTGRGFTLQGTFTFLEQNVDYLIIGGTLGAQPLGLYGLGYRMSELPYKAIVDPVAEVAFPGFARLQARGEDPTRPFLAYLRFVVLVAFPMGVILAGVTVPFIQTILGPRWEALQGVLPILAVWGSVRTLQGAIGWFLNSVGHTERLAVSYGCMLVFTIPLLLVNAHLFGLPGVAASMLLSMMIMLMIGVHITSQRVGIGWRVQWHAIRPSVLASIPAGGSAAAASAMFHRLPAGVVLAIGVAVGVAVYGAAVRLLAPGLIGEARRQLSRILRTMPV